MTKKPMAARLKVCVPHALKKRLAEHAEVTGLSEAEIIRRALVEFFERQDWRNKIDAYYENDTMA